MRVPCAHLHELRPGGDGGGRAVCPGRHEEEVILRPDDGMVDGILA